MIGKILIFLAVLMVFAPAFSQETEKKKKKDKIEFDGRAEIGLDFEAIGGLGGRVVNDSQLDRLGTVETELKVLPADNVELEFDLEFDYRFTDINLKKLFARYNFDNANVRVGFMKKMFGLEEINGAWDNLFIKKSVINGILEDFFLLGHDFTAQYRYNFPSFTLVGGYSADGSNRHFGNLTLITEKLGKATFVIAAMYANYLEKGFPGDENSVRHGAFFGNLGMEFEGKRTDIEFEGFGGKNPEPSVGTHPISYLDRSDIGFLGFRFQESFPIKIKRKHLERIIPYYELSYFNAWEEVSAAYFEVRPGINFNLTKRERFQWRTNVDLLFTANNHTESKPKIISQRVTTAIMVKW